MAGSSLLLLLDDIAALLDDVSVMTKVAAKKTAGVLGDDLAVNADQVTGVKADRELPVVWAVAKGSLRNKLILVPAALVASAVAPWAITPVLMMGGLYLCYEGFEKVAHHFLESPEEKAEASEARQKLLTDPGFNAVEYEKKKISGAIRTDFILSTEIIVITLGIIAQSDLVVRIGVLSAVALLMTIGVYGTVAGIVKMDDGGLALSRIEGEGPLRSLLRWLGRRLVSFAPLLLRILAYVGTIAMFMVGGGILIHGFHDISVSFEAIARSVAGIEVIGPVMGGLTPVVLNTLFGVLAGAVALAVVKAGGFAVNAVKGSD